MDSSSNSSLTKQEINILKAAFDAAIKSSQDSLAAASVLLPLLQKICDQKE
jgi:hypothetical protein